MSIVRRCLSPAFALVALAACGDVQVFPDAGDDDVDAIGDELDATGGDADPDAAGPDASPLDGPTPDAARPTVTITPPATPTNDPTPTFQFTTTGTPNLFECRVDNDTFGPCTTTSSHTSRTLTNDGTHTFQVSVADATGHGATAGASIVLDTTPPTFTFGTVPASPTPLSQVQYTWTTTGGVTLTECRPLYQQNVVPAPAYAPCGSPHTAATFNHAGTITMVFDVRVRDAAGNITTAQDTFNHYIVQ